jgi:hypothetical protein
MKFTLNTTTLRKLGEPLAIGGMARTRELDQPPTLTRTLTYICP